jgi:HAD superfamily hydrolase (TIGR01662 family)
MNTSPIRHILFDLGGTLMHASKDWIPVLELGDQSLGEKLLKHGITIDPKIFRARLHKYYEQRDKDFRETTYHFVLGELLKELGYAEVPESVIRSALDALYSVTQTNWKLEEDALETLQKLKSLNCKLGIFSNAGDDKDVQELIETFGIRSYFDFVLTSATCFYRKPHPRAFEIALAQWNISPEEAAMVGDSLEADIVGGKNLGMKSIWITRRAQFKDEEMRRIKPDFSMRKLNELLPILERISISRT